MTQDEFIAELLRLYPQLRVEVKPNGEKVIHVIRLKTEEERRADRAQRVRARESEEPSH